MMSTFAGKVLKGAAIISAFTLICKALGMVQKSVMAYHFGIGFETDAFVLAFSSVVFTFFAIPQQLLSPFLPLFVERKEKASEQDAWRFAGSLGLIVALIMGTLVIVGMVTAPSLVELVSSAKVPAATRALAVTLTRIMLPAAFFMGLFYLLVLVLNSYKKFALPAMGDAINKLLVIGLLVGLYPWLGIKGLAVGVLVGAFAALALQCFGIRRTAVQFNWRIDLQDPTLRRFTWLLPPIALSIAAGQARTILDYWFASDMGSGYAASLNYARGLSDTLILIVPSAVGVAIYPFFSDLSAEEDRKELMDSLMKSVKMMAYVFIPLSVLFIMLRFPIVQLIYQYGKFDMAALEMTTGPLLYYSIGLTFFAIEILLIKFYFSLKDTWTPMLVGIGCVGIHVGVILIFRDVLQHQSMALAATVSKTAKVIFLLLLLRRKSLTVGGNEYVPFITKGLGAAICMAGATWLAYWFIGTMLPLPGHESAVLRAVILIAQLGFASIAGLAAYAGASICFKIEEAMVLRSIFQKGMRLVSKN